MSANWAWLRLHKGFLVTAILSSVVRVGLMLIAGAGIVAADRAEGISIPLLVLEILVSPYEVIDGKIVLIVKEARTPTDDLLELDHIIDRSQEDDITYVLGVHSGREFLRGGKDSRDGPLVILKIFELQVSFLPIIGGNPFAVVGVGVGLMLVNHVADDGGMKLCSTEDDGLVVGVDEGEKLLDAVLIALTDIDIAVIKVLLRIDLVFVYLTLDIIIGVVGIGVDIAGRYADAEGGEVAILDALFEGIGVNGISEIAIGVRVLLSFRRSGHAELVGVGEIVHQLTPLALVVGTSAVTLIDDDEVEEIRGVLLIVGLPGGVFGHEGLEDGEIEVSGFRHLVMVLAQFLGRDARFGVVLELLKVVRGLVGEDVSVGNKEDAGFESVAV